MATMAYIFQLRNSLVEGVETVASLLNCALCWQAAGWALIRIARQDSVLRSAYHLVKHQEI
jgi:hypothetical protein